MYYNNVELPIDTHSEGFHLITRVQDEAHRFAIEYHKSLRGKKEIHSILDDISGIGPKRRLALMRQFGDINAIREATVAQLADVEGMNERAAHSERYYNIRADCKRYHRCHYTHSYQCYGKRTIVNNTAVKFVVYQTYEKPENKRDRQCYDHRRDTGSGICTSERFEKRVFDDIFYAHNNTYAFLC